MAATVKLWMLVPHHDFPANGPLVLGSIIGNLSEPGDSLNEGAIVEIPQNNIHEMHKYDYRTTIESTTNGGAGVLARYLTAFPWGKLGASFEAKTATHFHFQDLETTYFSPKPSYVKQSVSKHDVQEYLEGANYAPVFMITGLKISRGLDAQVTNRSSYGLGGQGRVGLTANVAGCPIVIDEGDVTMNQSRLGDTSFGGSSDFVIGYRLGKISFHENEDGDHISKLTSHTVGAMWSADDEDEKGDASAEMTSRVQFDGDDAIVKDLCQEELTLAIDEEDDQECRCFIVPAEEVECP
jgi:hypothetical protein